MLVRLKQSFKIAHPGIYAAPQNQVKWLFREAGRQFYNEVDTKIVTCQQIFANTLCSCQSVQLLLFSTTLAHTDITAVYDFCLFNCHTQTLQSSMKNTLDTCFHGQLIVKSSPEFRTK